MTTTRAEIPAETAAAQRSEYDAAVPVDLIGPHPDNIRHDAIADDELVGSIRENGLLQPLVVIPAGVTGPTYQLIAGHRRLDGLKRAGFTHAPAVIRHDLHDKADQLAAMLVENGRRADLTPIEEAEGFDLLTELGWKVDQIAEATGRSQTLVRARRRLTQLPDKTRDAVHGGQVHIEHAIALAELPAAEQADLERHLGGPSFKYELERARARATRKAEVDQEIADLKARGVPGHQLPAGVHNAFMLNHADHGMVRIETTGIRESDNHDGCLAYVADGTKQHPSIALVCTDPSNHDDQLSEQQRERRDMQAAEEAEREQRAAQAREKAEATRIARQLRLDAAMGIVKPNPKIDPGLERLVRLALPEIMRSGGVAGDVELSEALNVPDEHRTYWGAPTDDWLEASLAEATTPQLVKILAGFLITTIEQSVAITCNDAAYSDVSSEVPFVRAWFDLLEQAGHERNDVDEDLLATLTTTPEEE